MRKFLRLSLLTAVLTLVMSAAVRAESISTSQELSEGTTYTNIEISGNVTVTVPAGGIYVKSSIYNQPAINIKANSNVTIKGADGASIKHGDTSILYTFINVEKDATLTLENIDIDGCSAPDAGKFYDGIHNYGTLNIKKGTKLHNFYIRRGARLGGAVYNEGNLNIEGGEIYNNGFTGGGGLFLRSGNVTISGGTVHDNSTHSIYAIGGTFELTGGLIEGTCTADYGSTGLYKAGPVSYIGTTPTRITVVDETTGDSLEIDKGHTLLANTSNIISAVIGDDKHTGTYYGGNWNFISATHDAGHEHEVNFDVSEVYLDIGETAEISATVLCVSGNFGIKEPQLSNTGIIQVEKITGPTQNNPTTVFRITAKKPGTVVLTVKTEDDKATDTCKITVFEDNTIHDHETAEKLENGEEAGYDEIKISPDGNGELTVNIPESGINVGSKNGGNCITIAGGTVTLKGGTIRHQNEGEISSKAIIFVAKGATLILDGASIEGNYEEGMVVKKANTVLYGIQNEGTVYIKDGTSITKVNVDDDILENAVLYNAGTMYIQGGTVYANDPKSYAIKNTNTLNVTGGLVVGYLPENHNIQKGNAGPIRGTLIDGTITDGGANTIEGVNIGDGLVAATVKSGDTEGFYEVGQWNFIEPAMANVAYIKGKNVNTNNSMEDFKQSVVIDSEGNKDESVAGIIDDKFTVSTGYYTNITPVDETAEKEYLLFEISIPKGKSVYIKNNNPSYSHDYGLDVYAQVWSEKYPLTGNGVTDSTNSEYLHQAYNSAYDITILGKCIVEKGDDSGNLFGVILDNLYAKGTTARIFACTEDQYNDARKEFIEFEPATTDSPSTVSLELE